MAKTTTAKSSGARAVSAGTETVAQVLEREQDQLIHDWLALAEKQQDLMTIPLVRRPHRTFASVVIRCDSPAAPGFLDENSYLRRSQSSRRSAAQTGLLCGHGRGRVTTVAGVSFLHSAQEHQATKLREPAARRGNHRGRSGCATKTANAALHGCERGRH
jgi:hypothetical protein